MGLLENHEKHAWRRSISQIGARERMTVKASLFLARKTLDLPPDPNLALKHAALLSKKASAVPPAFLSFVDRQIDRMFRVGWDRGYEDACLNTIINPSACRESEAYPLVEGGTRAAAADHEPWFRRAMVGEALLPGTHRVNFKEVRAGGKTRGVTISSWRHHVLSPLHRILYDVVSSKGWCLRGEAKAGRFNAFNKKPGEVFVSGDYESATDGLNLEVTERILGRILERCAYVHPRVRAYALRTLRAEIRYEFGTVKQCRGQLMGNYLSFPLLCLTNYLVFRFLVPRPDIPVKINGDDIVFRCRPAERDAWMSGVNTYGLTLSVGKTMVDPTFFSLNSAFFQGCRGRTVAVPVIRSSMLNPSQYPLGLGGSLIRFLRGWKGDERRFLGGWFLRAKQGVIRASGRSVVEDLGIPADNAMLHCAGMAIREAFYRGSKPVEAYWTEILDPVPSDRATPRVEGWCYIDAKWVPKFERKQFRNDFGLACLNAAWSFRDWKGAGSSGAWWAACKATGGEDAYHRWRGVLRELRRSWVARLCRRVCSTTGSRLRDAVGGRSGERLAVPVILGEGYRSVVMKRGGRK